MLVFTTLFGSSNMIWGASGVQLLSNNVFSGGETADCGSALGWCVSPHFSCNEPVSFLLDLAFVTNSTTQVGMTLGDFVTGLIDIAIQMAMELGLKGLMAGCKSLYKFAKYSKKAAKANKVVSVADDAFLDQMSKELDDVLDDAVKLDAVVDDAAKLDGVADDAAKLDGVADDAVDQADDAGSRASGISKYADEVQDDLDTAEMEIDAWKSWKNELDELADAGKIGDEAYETMRKGVDDKINTALFQANEAATKLDEMGDSRWTLFMKELSGQGQKQTDELVNKVDDAGSWENWFNLNKWDESKYPVGGWFDSASDFGNNIYKNAYNLYAGYKSTKMYWQVLAASGDSWMSDALYPFVRRLEKDAYGLLYKPSRQSMYTSFSSDERGVYWPVAWGGSSREDVINSIDNSEVSDFEATTTAATGDRFEWVDETVGSTGTTTRFTWANAATAPADYQWADEDFARANQVEGRFAWTVTEEEEEEEEEIVS